MIQYYVNSRRNVDSEKKSESQLGFEPTTLRDLHVVGCSITEVLETLW